MDLDSFSGAGHEDRVREGLSGVPVTSFYSGAAGEIFSTAEDLAKWSHGLYHEGRVLSQQSVDQMLDFLPVQAPDEPLAAGYGLGVVRFSPELFRGVEAWGHGGNAPAYAAGSVHPPGYGVSIGIATDTDEGVGMGQTLDGLLSVVASHLEPSS